MKYYTITDEQINNIMEVLSEWKAVIESFIEEFELMLRLAREDP